jgi:hypothetical protein
MKTSKPCLEVGGVKAAHFFWSKIELDKMRHLWYDPK